MRRDSAPHGERPAGSGAALLALAAVHAALVPFASAVVALLSFARILHSSTSLLSLSHVLMTIAALVVRWLHRWGCPALQGHRRRTARTVCASLRRRSPTRFSATLWRRVRRVAPRLRGPLAGSLPSPSGGLCLGRRSSSSLGPSRRVEDLADRSAVMPARPALSTDRSSFFARGRTCPRRADGVHRSSQVPRNNLT